jgi:hypothetical protein
MFIPRTSLNSPDISKVLKLYKPYLVPVLLTRINFKNKIYVDSAFEAFTMKQGGMWGEKSHSLCLVS